jgi:hypothetical protein
MDQIQIHITQPGLLEGFSDDVARSLIGLAFRWDFGCEEDLGARDRGGVDGGGAGGFVAVGCCGVDLAVAFCERVGYDGLGFGSGPGGCYGGSIWCFPRNPWEGPGLVVGGI